MSPPVDVLGPLASQHDANIIMGPSQVAYMVQLLLYSSLVTQLGHYVRSGEFATHNKVGKIALGMSLLLNSAYTGLVMWEIYYAGVSQKRGFDDLTVGDTAWNYLLLLNGLMAALTESFLAVRAAGLLPNKRLRLVFRIWMGVLVATILVGSMSSFAVVFVLNEYRTPALPFNTAMFIFLYSTFAATLSISGACAYGLSTRISSFNIVTDSLLRRLILIVVRTASYTSVFSLLAAVMLTVWHDYNLNTFIGLAFWIPLPGLFGLATFTFSVGSRRAVDNGLGAPSHNYLPHISSSQPRPGVAAGSVARNPTHLRARNGVDSGHAPTPLQVSVERSSVVVVEEGEAVAELKKQHERSAERDLV